MGLDQYWWDEDGNEIAYLRKCSPIQVWMEEHVYDSEDLKDANGLKNQGVNGLEVEVSIDQMSDLYDQMKADAIGSGTRRFFFGGSWNLEELEEYAIPEVEKVITALEAGHRVTYAGDW